MTTTFKKLSVTKFDSESNSRLTSESLYWKAFNFPVTVKEKGAVTHVEFSPADSRFFAVSASTNVQIYNTINTQVNRTLSRSHEAVYGGSFRKDGKLLIAGGEEGKVRLFDLASKSLIRVFSGHSGAVHACKFTMDNSHVISFSNDKKIIMWDVPGEIPLLSYDEHKDYVQTGAVSRTNNMFISGSYDHTVKMFDPRTSTSVLTMDHGAPVESVLIFPSGGALISAGGLEVKVWDVIGGGKLITKLCHHHKTVTCVSFASQGKRLLSGSLDRHVKIYDINTYHVIHTLDFPSPILSVGIPDCDSSLVVGMSNGLLSIQNRPKVISSVSTNKSVIQSVKPNEETAKLKNKEEKIPPHEKFLRQFQITRALDHVLRHHLNNNPEIAMAVIQELFRRRAIKAAVAGEEDEKIAACLQFIFKHISNPTFTWLMVDFGNVVLDTYNVNLEYSPKVRQLFKRLSAVLKKEIERMKDMMALSGTIELLLAAGNAGKVSGNFNNDTPSDVLLSNNTLNGKTL